jgi:hypothetical protein
MVVEEIKRAASVTVRLEFDCKRLRRAVLTRVGDGCDCGRLCPQILKWTRPVRKLALYVAEGLLISSV